MRRMSLCCASVFFRGAHLTTTNRSVMGGLQISWSERRYKRQFATKAAASGHNDDSNNSREETDSAAAAGVDPQDPSVIVMPAKVIPVTRTSFFKGINRHDAPMPMKADLTGQLANSHLSLDRSSLWQPQKIQPLQLMSNYLMLSKYRLTGLVVATQMSGYAIAPGTFDPYILAYCTVGTALTSCAANTMNQYFEVPYDSQMNRTKNRVLVRGLMSPLHAVVFANVCGLTGIALLAHGTNMSVVGLGAFNLALYTLCYTPMKRMNIANTWVGAVVGAIPPMMGWAAATGGLEPGAWLLGAIMFSWQFPHFCALSWNLRPDYARAGYRMMSVVDPALCKRVALRHCVYLTGLCLASVPMGVTSIYFGIDSLPLNLYFTYLGWRFYRDGDSKSSRKLFLFSLIHIPALMVLMIVGKEGGEDYTELKKTFWRKVYRVSDKVKGMAS